MLHYGRFIFGSTVNLLREELISSRDLYKSEFNISIKETSSFTVPILPGVLKGNIPLCLL